MQKKGGSSHGQRRFHHRPDPLLILKDLEARYKAGDVRVRKFDVEDARKRVYGK